MKIKVLIGIGLMVVLAGVIPGRTVALPDDAPANSVIPTITGPLTPCQGFPQYDYYTEPFKTNYQWDTIIGGQVVSGGQSTDFYIRIKWTEPGPHTITVTYLGASGPGSLTVDVQPALPVNVAVTPSANNVCAGTPVTFTANVTNGGATPEYSWIQNGSPVTTATSSTYTYVPADGDQVACYVVSSYNCPVDNAFQSDPVTMLVVSEFPVSVNVLASPNPACTGEMVTFTAEPFNGGNNPVYQWKKGGTIIYGATNPTYSYAPLNNDHISCVLTSSLNCTSGNPATSEVIMTVSPSLPVGITITPSQNPVCTGNQVTFTSNVTNGGSSPVYDWFKNGVSTGNNSATLSYVPTAGDIVYCRISSSQTCQTGSPANSNAVAMGVTPFQPVSVVISPSANPVCHLTPVTFTAIPTNGGGSPQFEWFVNGTSVGNINPYTYIPNDGQIVTCVVTSSFACPTGNPATSNAVTMTVSSASQLGVTVTPSATTACSGTPILFTATATNCGTNPGFQWKRNGDIISGATNSTLTYTPQNGDTFTCTVTSNAQCSMGAVVTSTPVAITVSNGLPVSVTITASENPICPGTPVTFNATAINQGTVPQFQWKVNGVNVGTNITTYSYTPADGDVITCVLISNLSCAIGSPATSNAITMSVVNSVTAAVSITASSNPACVGQTVTFTATGTNGGQNPTYNWTVGGVPVTGNNTPVYSAVMLNGQVVTCEMVSSFTCATNNPALSNAITMTVLPNLPVAITISTLTNPSCMNLPVTFTSVTTGGGASPSYLWKVNGNDAGFGSTMSYVPVNNDQIKCILTSSYTCPVTNPATSNIITQTTTPNVNPALSISADANPVCNGTVVTFTATPVNGGSNPTYQWKVNGLPAGNNTSTFVTTPLNGDQVTCTMTSNHTCLNSNQATASPITMTVSNSLAAGVTIQTNPANANPFCQGTTVNFTSAVTNCGNTPQYQWLINGLPAALPGGTNATYSYVPSNEDFVTCKVMSSLTCANPKPATSNPIFMLMNNSLSASVSITVAGNPVCAGGTAELTAIPLNGGTSPSYQWKVNGTPSGANSPNFNFSPVTGGEVVTCTMSSSEPCAGGNPATSNAITLMVAPAPVPSIEIETRTNPFCTGSPVKFTASVSNGGTTPGYQWKVNGIPMATGAIFTYSPLTGEVVHCTLTSSASCIAGTTAESNDIVMTGNTTLPLAITVTASSNPVCQGKAVTYIASPVNGGENPVYEWKKNGTPVSGVSNSTYTTIPSNGNTITCKVVSSMTCAVPAQLESNPPLVQVVDPSSPVSFTISASANPVCLGTSVTFTAANQVNAGSAPAYQWRINGLPVPGQTNATYTCNPVNTDVVTATLRSNAHCASSNPAVSNSIAMVVNTPLPVVVNITASDSVFCPGNTVVFNAVVVNGGSLPQYQWMNHGTPIPGATNITYIHTTPANGDQISCQVISNHTCVTNSMATSQVITLTQISSMPVNATITPTPNINTVCPGTPITFSTSVTNGGSSPSYSWRVNGAPYGSNTPNITYTVWTNVTVYCIVTSSLGCASPNKDTSNVIAVNIIPTQPVSVTITSTGDSLCEGTMVTYTANAVNPGTDPFYRFWVNGIPHNTYTSNVYSYIPQNGDQISCFVRSNAPCAIPNNATSSTITQVVLSNVNVGVTIAPSANPVCYGTNVTYTAVPVNGGSAPDFQWKVNGVSAGTSSPTFTYAPENNDVIRCVMTSNTPCTLNPIDTSNAVTMNVSPVVPVGVTIMASANPVCEGTVTLSAAPINGGTAPAYQWKVNGVDQGPNNSIFTYSPVNNDVITCTLTSNAGCAQGNPAISQPLTLAVMPSEPVSVSVAPATLPLPSCQGSPVTFLATAVNGGSTPSYQWLVNGMFVGSDNPSFTYIPDNGDQVQCMMQSNTTCPTGNPAVSNQLTMNFQPVLMPGVSITPSVNPACLGTGVTFSAAPVNGGANPGYQWYRSTMLVAGETNQTYNCVPDNSDVIYCVMSADIPCPLTPQVSSNSITMSVLPLQSASVSIATQFDTVCSGTTVNFTATGVNPGSGPVYQWKVNGSNMGTGITFAYIPQDGDVVTCEMLSSVSCIAGNPALSNPITMTVRSSFPVNVQVTPSLNPSCVGQPVTFNAVATNGGVNPEYRWMVNGYNVGNNSPTYTYVPTTGQVVTCEVKSGYTCEPTPVLSNSINMVVNPIRLPIVTITGTMNPACTGTQITYTATPVNGGASPSYQWRVNGINSSNATNATFQYTPSNNEVITCLMNSSEQCIANNPATSNAINMIVSSSFSASVSVLPTDTMVCINTPVTFSATPAYGGPSPAYQWVVNGDTMTGATNSTYTCQWGVANNYIVECLMSSALTCAPAVVVSNTVTMVVLGIPVGVTIASNTPLPVCAGDPVTFAAIHQHGGPSPTYQWRVNNIPTGPNSPNFTYIPADGDTVTCLLESNATCSFGHLATSNPITVPVNPVLPVSINITPSSNPVCSGSLVTMVATAVNGGPTPGYQWFVNGNNVGANGSTYSYLPADGDVVTCSLVSSAVCPGSTMVNSNAVTLSVNPLLPVSLDVTVSENPVCSGSSVTFTATPVNGGTIPEYQWYLNAGLIGGATNSTYSYPPADQDVITCTLKSNVACPSGTPATGGPVTMTVNPSLPVGITIAASANPVCAGMSVTYTATPVNGGNLPGYQWFVNSILIQGATNVTFTYTPANNDTILCQLNSSLPCPGGNPAISLPIVAISGAPPVSFSTCIDQQTFTTAPPVQLRGGYPSGGIYTGPGVNSGTGVFDPSAAGPGTHTITYTYPPSGLCTGSNTITIHVQAPPPFTCGDNLTDIRDGKTYPTVLAGTRCWMAANLNYGIMKNSQEPQVDDCVSEKFCASNMAANCNLYGGLYQWGEVMRYDAAPGSQGICPPGWHVPAEAEWDELFTLNGGKASAGEALKNTGPGNFGATMGGLLYQNNSWSFTPPGFPATMFWTSDPDGPAKAKAHGMNSAVNSVSDYSALRANGFSVRCVRN